MKKIIPAFLITLVSGFMFFIFEPINMYATNINDFWFDFFIMIKPTAIMFAIYFFVVLISYLLILGINRIFSKNTHIYNFLIIIGFIFLFYFYIQGNFLIAGLPPLDGTKIIWNEYKTGHVLSLLSLGVTTLLVTFAVLKFKYKKTVKALSFITFAIFIMLSTSLISTILTNDTFIHKDRNLTATIKNINNASNDKNFYIFLVDAVDSNVFNDVLQKSDNKNMFEDFTYFPDTMSGYPFTRDSIPFILSGIWNENETSFDEYSNMAYDNSKLIDKLIEEKYNVNLYEDELIWSTDKALNVDNLFNNMGIIEISYARNILKYVGFKYLPYQLKQYSMIETMNFNNCRKPGNIDYFTFGDVDYYNKYLSEDNLEKTEDKYFSFTHIEGAHTPLNLDKDLNHIEEGTYEQKVEACITIISRFIDRLKQNGVYDNSVIIITSDHGFDYKGIIYRNTPILYIKGIDEKHELYISDLPISHADMVDACLELLDGKKSDEIFTNIDKNRKRRFIVNEYLKEDHMVEYEQTGSVNDEDQLLPTGNVFDR